ncbi:MAG: serine protease [Sulfuritalea sp.]|jgi:S1-C subfamily serine protease|nr:serine protease [Sulfuritalea sp.]
MLNLWQRCHASVFSLTFESDEGRISSGTGFKVNDLLVTNNHVMQIQGARRIVLRSVLQDSYTRNVELSFGHPEFRSMLLDGDPETGWDYAVLKVPHPAFAAVPALQLDESEDVQVGTQIALFGFQFEQSNLSMHVGYVSSQFQRADVRYIQLDSSVNQGNSGGPLINFASGRVIGMVTRKATGLTQQFDDLHKAIRQNIDLLQASQRSGARGTVGGVDPVVATIAIEVQMERIAKEIARSANVGIGYAYHIKKVRDSIANLS